VHKRGGLRPPEAQIAELAAAGSSSLWGERAWRWTAGRPKASPSLSPHMSPRGLSLPPSRADVPTKPGQA